MSFILTGTIHTIA